MSKNRQTISVNSKYLLGFLLIGLVSCTQGVQNKEHEEHQGHEHNMGGAAIQKAVCVLYPTAGNDASGIVTFTSTADGMKVVADVTGLTPGKHGFHIHEYGDCSSPDGKSAGGHFNPEHMEHAGPMDAQRHEGDLGNLVADENGVAHLELTDRQLTFEGPHSIIGRGIIVHADEDDLVSQPTGNAGARVACGTIGVATQ